MGPSRKINQSPIYNHILKSDLVLGTCLVCHNNFPVYFVDQNLLSFSSFSYQILKTSLQFPSSYICSKNTQDGVLFVAKCVHIPCSIEQRHEWTLTGMEVKNTTYSATISHCHDLPLKSTCDNGYGWVMSSTIHSCCIWRYHTLSILIVDSTCPRGSNKGGTSPLSSTFPPVEDSEFISKLKW